MAELFLQRLYMVLKHPRTMSGNPNHEPTEDLVAIRTRLLDCLWWNTAEVAATIRDVPEDLGLANNSIIKERLTHSYTYLAVFVIYIYSSQWGGVLHEKDPRILETKICSDMTKGVKSSSLHPIAV